MSSQEAIENGTECTGQESELISPSYTKIFILAAKLLKNRYPALIDQLVEILLDESDCRSYNALAEDLIPEEVRINPVVAKKIIHLAVQEATRRYNDSLSPDALPIDLRLRDSRVKTAINKQRQSGEAMLEAMGRTPFTQDGINYIVLLMHSSDFQHKSGANKGKPNWLLITEKYNEVFGLDRNPMSLADQIKVMRHKGDPRLELAYQAIQSSQSTMEA